METHTESQLATTSDLINDPASKWNILYCSHLWSNSHIRKDIINAHDIDSKTIKYCYTCRGKIRKYQVKSSSKPFTPENHSTPNIKGENSVQLPIISAIDISSNTRFLDIPSTSITQTNDCNVATSKCIPSISSQIDSSFRQKYTSYELHSDDVTKKRLRKSVNGLGCIVNFALTDRSMKKRTQIQACSISVMVVAIVVITLVLVNFTTPIFTQESNRISTTVVPTLRLNQTFSIISDMDTASPLVINNSSTDYISITEKYMKTFIPTEKTLFSNALSKIRNNVKTYPKDVNKSKVNLKPKEIATRDLISQKFCSCQINEVCMLDENTGTAICRKAIDVDDPTGCGGLCALETEACHLVDRVRGVRVCRLLTTVMCSPLEWRCHNGLCVPAAARCDGLMQCYDKSDEIHCDCDLTKQFRCGNLISCFPKEKLCDGVIDCWDGFDETNCTTDCPEQQFTCTDGQCILPSQFCDGFADCGDSSDEPLGCGGACAAHEIRCDNSRCVARSVRCDGRDNCGDASDEKHCI